MAAISSSAIVAALTLNPSRKRFTALSSSTSLFSSCNRAGLQLFPKRVNYVNRNRGMSCNCLFGLGVPELVVIAGVTALVFGPKQLPEVGRSLGKTIKSFQQAAKEFESELKKDNESSGEPPAEEVTTASEEEKKEAKVSSVKESS